MKLRIFLFSLLALVFNAGASAQTFSFIGLAWGDSYATINSKLQAAGFSKMLELKLYENEGAIRVKSRLFEDGRLLGRSANGAIWLEDNRLIGVKVDITSESSDTKRAYDDVTNSLTNRYGRANIGFTKNQSEWGNSNDESISVSITPKKFASDPDGITVHYKSARWKIIEREYKKNETSKF